MKTSLYSQVDKQSRNPLMDPIMDALKMVKEGVKHPHMSLAEAEKEAGHSEKPFDLVGLIKDSVPKGWNFSQYSLTLLRAL